MSAELQQSTFCCCSGNEGLPKFRVDVVCESCGKRREGATAVHHKFIEAVSSVLGLLEDTNAKFLQPGATGTPAELKEVTSKMEKLLVDSLSVTLTPQVEATERRELIRKRAISRKMVLEELVCTEEDYVKDLNTLNTVWRPMLENSGLLTQQGSATLFGTIPQLEFLGSELLREMKSVREKPLQEQKLGEIMLKKVPFMRLYIEHCSEHSRGMLILKDLSNVQRFLDLQDVCSVFFF